MVPDSFKRDPTRVMHVCVLSVFLSLAFVSVVLRLWARKIQRNILDLSDYLIVAGLVWTIGVSVFTIYSNIWRQIGDDATQIRNPKAIHDLVIFQLKACQTTWAVAVFFIRASVLTLYIRIFDTRIFRITGHIVHGINFAFLVSTILAAFLICRPLAYSWDKAIPGGWCGDQRQLDLYIGTVNLLLDITVVVLPMPLLWGLQMARNKKIILSGMFGLGIIICVLTLIRIKISNENHGANAQEVYSRVALYANLEAILGVINTCLPVMKPIFVKIYSSKASTWISTIASGSIPIVMRISHMGSAWRTKPSKGASTFGQPAPEDVMASEDKGTIRVALQRSPLPTYADGSPKHPSRATLNSAMDPASPILLQNNVYHPPTRHWQSSAEKDPSAIYVERSWDVDVERGGSSDSDRQSLVKDGKKR